MFFPYILYIIFEIIQIHMAKVVCGAFQRSLCQALVENKCNGMAHYIVIITNTNCICKDSIWFNSYTCFFVIRGAHPCVSINSYHVVSQYSWWSLIIFGIGISHFGNFPSESLHYMRTNVLSPLESERYRVERVRLCVRLSVRRSTLTWGSLCTRVWFEGMASSRFRPDRSISWGHSSLSSNFLQWWNEVYMN